MIHGGADPLVNLKNGVDTHEVIPGSELLLIEGIGHDLPKGAWPRIIDGISTLTEAALRRREAAGLVSPAARR